MSKLVPVSLEKAEKILLDDGLLYAINKLVLHPVGMALSLSYEGDGGPGDPAVEIMLMKTDDDDFMEFSPEMDAKCKEKLSRFLSARMQSRINVATQDEHSSLSTLLLLMISDSK
jgi:hypothetical protein